MPIKKENRLLYPKNWSVISKKIRDKTGKCEFCGLPQYALIYKSTRQLVGGNAFYDQLQYAESYKTALEAKRHLEQWGNSEPLTLIVLTVAHLDHNPANCERSNLKALCQKCHFDYDQAHHTKNAKRTHFEKMRCKETLELFSRAI